MKKMMAFVLLCSLLLTLAACGSPDSGNATDAGEPAASSANAGAPPVLPAAGAGTPEEDGETDPAEESETPAPPEEPPQEQPTAPKEKPSEKPQEKPAEVQPKPVIEEEPVLEPSSASVTTEEPKEQPAPPAEQPAASAESAASYIGQNVSSLISALGNPLSRTYAPSCLGDGEDGELAYSGFTVYTYREGDSETVQAVE